MPADAPPLDAPALPDAGPSCLGADGLPCLTVGSAAANMPADVACTPAEPAPGTVSPRRLRLVAVGPTRTLLADADFEVWPGNVVRAPSCAPPECVALRTDATGVATADLDAGFFAYVVPQNAVWMTYRAIGYNRTAGAIGETDLAVLPSATGSTCPFTGCPFMADPADSILRGTVSDCRGARMRGATIALFDSTGAAIDLESGEPFGPWLAYLHDGVLLSSSLTTTDYSGALQASNIPILTDPRVAVVAYGTAEEGGLRRVVACEEVVMGPNAITFLDFGPYRSDYAPGSLCLDHAPP